MSDTEFCELHQHTFLRGGQYKNNMSDQTKADKPYQFIYYPVEINFCC